MIVVEGVDNSGKSTILYDIASKLNLYSLKVASRPKHINDVLDCLDLVKKWDQDCGKKLIVDRLQMISEYIYGPICRQTGIITDGVFEGWLEAEHHAKPLTPYVIIHCRPPTDRIVKTILERNQMAGVNEHLQELVDRYDVVMERVAKYLPTVIWNYASMDFNTFLYQLKVKGGLDV